MIIRFNDGSAIDSSAIASIHAEKATTGQYAQPPRILIAIFREDFMSFGGNRRTHSHWRVLPMETDEQAVEECAKLTKLWCGQS